MNFFPRISFCRSVLQTLVVAVIGVAASKTCYAQLQDLEPIAIRADQVSAGVYDVEIEFDANFLDSTGDIGTLNVEVELQIDGVPQLPNLIVPLSTANFAGFPANCSGAPPCPDVTCPDIDGWENLGCTKCSVCGQCGWGYKKKAKKNGVPIPDGADCTVVIDPSGVISEVGPGAETNKSV